MDYYPTPLPKNSLEKIISQMNTSIFRISGKNGKFGIATFCTIKNKNEKIHVMISNYEIIDRKYLACHNSIKLLINNEIKEIEFGGTQYFNEDEDISIIEIKSQKNNIIKFLEIDDNLYNKEIELEINYRKEQIYIIHPNIKKDISVSFGVIVNIIKTEIIYSSFPFLSRKYSPILNLSNNKLIGLHYNNSKPYKKGILFNFIINEFIKEYRHFKKINSAYNKINILLEIWGADISKKVYFLDNHECEGKEDNKCPHNYLSELNESNTELFINGKKTKYRKYFIPEENEDYNYNIELKFNINLTDCSYMFASCKRIEKIDFQCFNTKYVKNMESMFENCKFRNIDLSNFDTANVTNMSGMFNFCDELTYLNLLSFNTENVINMGVMFFCCRKLKNIYISSFNCKKVENMSRMFYSCENLNELDLSFFDVQKVTDMSEMFKDCKSLNNLDLSSFGLKKMSLKDMHLMFSGCENLVNINLSFFDTRNVTDMSGLFMGCKKINNLDLTSFNTSNVTYMQYMFDNCENLKALNLTFFNTSKVTTMQSMFSNCKNLKALDLSSFDTNRLGSVYLIFAGCKKIIYESNKSKFKNFFWGNMH